MTELKNSRNYYKDLLLTYLLILVVWMIVLMFKPFDLGASIILILFISLALSTRKFTDSIKVDSSEVVIKYHRLFASKEIIVPGPEATFNLVKTTTFRGGVYYQLRVFRGKKLVYAIDSRDGFDKDSLDSIVQLQPRNN